MSTVVSTAQKLIQQIKKLDQHIRSLMNKKSDQQIKCLITKAKVILTPQKLYQLQIKSTEQKLDQHIKS